MFNRLHMKSECDRLKTFNDWRCSFMDPKELAKAGFYYFHFEDIVRCAFCRVEIGQWEVGDNAMVDHQRWSNDCPFICGMDVGNIPINNDTCERYGIEMRANAEKISSINLGINKKRAPVYSKYCTEESRLSTYKDWPKCMQQKPNELAEAGFFYFGKGDKTVCFSCGGGLKDWERNDDPWKQHAKWFSNCSFVHMIKGQSFINQVVNERIPTPETLAIEEPKNEQPLEDRMCKICFKEEIGIVFLPCGHIIACVKCAISLTNCAVCRQQILGTARVFLS